MEAMSAVIFCTMIFFLDQQCYAIDACGEVLVAFVGVYSDRFAPGSLEE
jgi:hypothetical protein